MRNLQIETKHSLEGIVYFHAEMIQNTINTAIIPWWYLQIETKRLLVDIGSFRAEMIRKIHEASDEIDNFVDYSGIKDSNFVNCY